MVKSGGEVAADALQAIWLCAFGGGLLGVGGGFLVIVTESGSGVSWYEVGLALLGVGGVFVSVAVIGWGVMLGVRAARVS